MARARCPRHVRLLIELSNKATKRRPAGRGGAFARPWLVLAIALGCDDDVERARPPAPPPPPSAAPITPKPPKPARHSTRYPVDRTHSPIDVVVAARLRGIVAQHPDRNDHAFAKVGDSITASGDFLRCFADEERPVYGHSESLRPLVRRFRGSFARTSEAARIGWSAWQALNGTPSPLARELAATDARFALVEFGTNDIEIGKLHHFADKLFDVVDFAIARGTIPILFTIPPRRDRKDAEIWVPRYNAVIRGIAQARQIPLVDYYREMLRLPGAGLGKDGIHPTTYHGKLGRNACDFGAEGLRHGYNVRNLLALTALSRVVKALEGVLLDAAEDAQASIVRELPFADYVVLDRERTFTLELDAATSLRALVFDRKGSVDLELAETRGERFVEQRLTAGRHTLRLRAAAPGAETLLVLMAD